VIAYGQAGHDVFIAAASPVPVMFFGDGGNDTLIGSAFADLLSGGNGADHLFGLSGHDVQLGGIGRDVLHRGKGDDLLMGAVTAHDRDLAALGDIVREWSASRPRETRRANLSDGSGSQSRQNGDTFLSDATLIDDAVNDLVFSDSRDWLLPFGRARVGRTGR
jgi:Ca2+-binding RTX toxin-like protein